MIENSGGVEESDTCLIGFGIAFAYMILKK